MASLDGSFRIFDVAMSALSWFNGGRGLLPQVPRGTVLSRRVCARLLAHRRPLACRAFVPRRAPTPHAAGGDVGGGHSSRGLEALEGRAGRRPVGAEDHEGAHTAAVTSVRWMPPESRLLITTGVDQLVKVWDVGRGSRRVEMIFSFHLGSAVTCSSFSPDRRQLVAAGLQGGAVRLCDLTSGLSTQTLLGHQGPVLSTAWHPLRPFLLLSASSDQSARLWDVRFGQRCVAFLDQRLVDAAYVASWSSSRPDSSLTFPRCLAAPPAPSTSSGRPPSFSIPLIDRSWVRLPSPAPHPGPALVGRATPGLPTPSSPSSSSPSSSPASSSSSWFPGVRLEPCATASRAHDCAVASVAFGPSAMEIFTAGARPPNGSAPSV
eukprot:GHVT01041041.1.p1 GENE.GHVT01041041.1~~GHVT01041041.1.p1  ORF type:complete len:377 (+),score=109.93 GHVT01041041.1:1045-2175(+)